MIDDLCGLKFNHLTVIKYANDYVRKKTGQHIRQWECQCDCGNIKIVREDSLKSGHTKSCGCLSYKDIKGNRYGRLLVLESIPERNKNRNVLWRCRCDCGNIIVVPTAYLINGNTKSCGCLQIDNTIKASLKHGFVVGGNIEKLYHIWIGMKQRCSNPKCKEYKNYGGRGITVCDEWANDYATFRQWAYSNGYDETKTKKECSIDRIDNNKGYNPNNCRWADSHTQANNTSKNVYLTWNNTTHTISEWSSIVGINHQTIRCRLKRGWSVEDALSKPVLSNKVKIKDEDE